MFNKKPSKYYKTFLEHGDGVKIQNADKTVTRTYFTNNDALPLFLTDNGVIYPKKDYQIEKVKGEEFGLTHYGLKRAMEYSSPNIKNGCNIFGDVDFDKILGTGDAAFLMNPSNNPYITCCRIWTTKLIWSSWKYSSEISESRWNTLFRFIEDYTKTPKEKWLYQPWELSRPGTFENIWTYEELLENLKIVPSKKELKRRKNEETPLHLLGPAEKQRRLKAMGARGKTPVPIDVKNTVITSESPDFITFNGVEYIYDDTQGDPRPFFLQKKGMALPCNVISSPPEIIHGQLLNRITNYRKWKQFADDHSKSIEDFNVKLLDNFDIEKLSRSEHMDPNHNTVNGRMWLIPKVISFWDDITEISNKHWNYLFKALDTYFGGKEKWNYEVSNLYKGIGNDQDIFLSYDELVDSIDETRNLWQNSNEPKRKKKETPLHLLNPVEKQRRLKAMGARGKTPIPLDIKKYLPDSFKKDNKPILEVCDGINAYRGNKHYDLRYTDGDAFPFFLTDTGIVYPEFEYQLIDEAGELTHMGLKWAIDNDRYEVFGDFDIDYIKSINDPFKDSSMIPCRIWKDSLVWASWRYISQISNSAWNTLFEFIESYTNTSKEDWLYQPSDKVAGFQPRVRATSPELLFSYEELLENIKLAPSKKELKRREREQTPLHLLTPGAKQRRLKEMGARGKTPIPIDVKSKTITSESAEYVYSQDGNFKLDWWKDGAFPIVVGNDFVVRGKERSTHINTMRKIVSKEFDKLIIFGKHKSIQKSIVNYKWTGGKLWECRVWPNKKVCGSWIDIPEISIVRWKTLFSFIDKQYGNKEDWLFSVKLDYGKKLYTYPVLLDEIEKNQQSKTPKKQKQSFEQEIQKQLHMLEPSMKAYALKNILGVGKRNPIPLKDVHDSMTSESTEFKVSNKYYAFDWDDNVMHMPTKIYTENDKGHVVPFSTEEFAIYRGKIGKEPFDFKGDIIVGYSTKFNPFKDFRVEGDEQFIKDVLIGTPGPVWDDFVEAVNSGSIFAIITARGHHPTTLSKAVFNLLLRNFNGLDVKTCISNLREYYENSKHSKEISDASLLHWYLNDLCKWYPVSYGTTAGAADPEQLKIKAMSKFQKHVKKRFNNMNMEFRNEVNNVFKLGFSDDDLKNVKTMYTHFPDMKIYATNTGEKKIYGEAVVPYNTDVTRHIRKGIKKAWKLGRGEKFKTNTFGFELEFKFDGEDDEWKYDEDLMIQSLLNLLQSNDNRLHYSTGIYNTRSSRDIEAFRASDLKVHFFSWQESNDLLPRYLSIDEWEDQNPVPNKYDYDDEEHYFTDKEDWQFARNKVEVEIEEYESNSNIEQLQKEFCEDLINGRISNVHVASFLDMENFTIQEGGLYNKIAEMKELIESYDEKTSDYGSSDYTVWQVGEDDGGVEIASKILTSKNMPKVKEILSDLKKKYLGKTRGDTSAHVHIGIPNDFTAFDICAVISMMDEQKAYLESSGRSMKHTKEKSKFIDLLYDYFDEILEDVKGSEINEETLKKVMLLNRDRYNGVNFWAKNNKVGSTIEFRYLSSEILNDVDNFLEWINYYQLLIRLARSRKRVTLECYDDLGAFPTQRWVVLERPTLKSDNYTVRLYG